MMSVSPGMASEQAGGYFSREDYYLRGIEEQGNSHWYGRGARMLGGGFADMENAHRA